MPDILLEHGKAANPWPNVDAHSGVLLQVSCWLSLCVVPLVCHPFLCRLCVCHPSVCHSLCNPQSASPVINNTIHTH